MPFSASSSLAQLIEAPVRAGRVEWIGVRPARGAPMHVLAAAELVAGNGVAGDRYGNAGGARQVTLLAAESLAAIASHLGVDAVAPEALRRNVVVRGMNLLALKGRRFRIGDAILEASGECHPCSRIEASLGTGGYNAARGLGGITARVVQGGVVRIGDRVEPIRSE
ncbi:MAG TPA: MOSC domain-containing protein [Caldimonas sp.]|nr:MOSC domain-containing protein [Caldimonas sp.]